MLDLDSLGDFAHLLRQPNMNYEEIIHHLWRFSSAGTLQCVKTPAPTQLDTFHTEDILHHLSSSPYETVWCSSATDALEFPLPITGIKKITPFLLDHRQSESNEGDSAAYEVLICSHSEDRFYLFFPIMFQTWIMGWIILLPGERSYWDIQKLVMPTIISHLLGLHWSMQQRENQLQITEDNLRKFTVVYELSHLFQKTMSLERRLHLILTTITIGDGFGFNRAALFMLDTDSSQLCGKMGVGPSSAEEAGRVWRLLKRRNRPYSEWVSSLLEAENTGESNFNRKVKSIRIPLDKSAGVFGQTVAEKRSFHVPAHECTQVCPQFVRELLELDNEFLTAPLLSADRVLGVIVVDNRFNQKAISKDDRSFLQLFASQVGVSVEISMLHKRLKELTMELEKQHKEMINKETLAALGEMAAMVAHEIRNPLVAIGGFARRLDKVVQEKLSSTEKKYTSLMIREVNRLEHLLQNVLYYSRKRPLERKRVDLTQLIGDVLFLFEGEFNMRKIACNTNLQDRVPPIFGDERELRQVIINLLLNAMEAMPSGGMIHITLSAIEDENKTVLCISDSGGGIDKELIGNIFNPFFSTREQGLGLGLTLIHRIVTKHEGKIEVQNRENEGLTVTLQFPSITEKD